MRKLKYPIMFYTKIRLRGEINSQLDLCKKTIFSYKTKFFDDMVIIDSNFNKYKVVACFSKIHWYVVLSNIVNFILSLGSRKLDEYCTWIDFELSEPEQITFEEAKVEILALFKKNPRWFKKSHENFDTIEEDLASYKSLQDMIENIGGYP